MKFGITMPNSWGIEDPQQALALGPLAEDLGFDSVWVMEHVFNTGFIKDRLGDGNYYHPLATLTYMAATTKKVMLGTSVLVLPYHNAIQLAKFAATLDQMSAGRLVLGVGAGALQVEFEALGVPMKGRGAWTNDCIRMMKELWTNPVPSYQSRRWNFSGNYFSPKPVQKPHIPLWVGGSSPAALRRAASLGDGWHPSGISPEEFAIGRQELIRLAADAGRDANQMDLSARIELDVPGDDSVRRAGDRRAALPGGEPGRMAAIIKAYEDVGVEHVILSTNTGNVADLTRQLETVAKDVIPQFK